jgi:hypothetical protein
MLHSSGLDPSWPLNQLACISRKIGESARSCAGAGTGVGGAGGIEARAAPQPEVLGLTGRVAAGTVVPSGFTNPTTGADCRVGYATVGEAMAPPGAAGAVSAAGAVAVNSVNRDGGASSRVWVGGSAYATGSGVGAAGRAGSGSAAVSDRAGSMGFAGGEC